MKTSNLISLPILGLALLVCAPAPGFAQSILGSSGNFAILGGTAVTSTGTAGTLIVNGNIGSGSGVSGFPPGQVVNGSIIGPGGPVVNQALLDLGKVQVGLAGMPSNVNESNVDLGGLTLLPGVYTFNGGATQNGALVLDANNQSNAFWVFQIATTLITSFGSTVNLINTGPTLGATDGIFWNAGTGITIGANSQILGNYLAGTSVAFGATTSGNGRALAQAGVTLDANPINARGGPNGSDYTGGLVFNGPNIVPVPEPAAFLWLAPLGAMGFAFWRRRAGNK